VYEVDGLVLQYSQLALALHHHEGQDLGHALERRRTERCEVGEGSVPAVHTARHAPVDTGYWSLWGSGHCVSRDGVRAQPCTENVRGAVGHADLYHTQSQRRQIGLRTAWRGDGCTV
jgi:hypothetical protein